MNELMLLVDNEDWLYFKTNRGTAETAYNDFLETCDAVGIDVSNMIFERCALRDVDGNDIDHIDWL